MTDRRLIEEWLPIAELGEESVRERRSLQALPPTYYLHVWWARRPLVASRAAVLASVLPHSADQAKFMRALGIHGDPVAAKRRIAIADRKGERLGSDAYGYPRAFSWLPDADDLAWLNEQGVTSSVTVLDPTGGGGSIPFESIRLGLSTYTNDINPVASLIQKATIEYPVVFGHALKPHFLQLGRRLVTELRNRMKKFYPEEPSQDCKPDGYLWARTIRCPYCDGLVPLSPNWKLAPDGTGVRLVPDIGNGKHDKSRHCKFTIVSDSKLVSDGTVSDGSCTCPFPDCARVIDGDDIKKQAQAGEMGEQLFAIVFKQITETRTRLGRRGRDKSVRGYRAPTKSDDNSSVVLSALAEKITYWDELGVIPNEEYPEVSNDSRPIQYGMPLWRDMFSPRQLLGHGTAIEVFHELLEQESKDGLSDLTRAAFVYLSLSLDKMLNWNARLSSWNVQLQGMRSVFDRHDFAFKWSYAEMAPLIPGNGYDWAIEQTAKCIDELVNLVRPETPPQLDFNIQKHMAVYQPPSLTISCKSADCMDHISDNSLDIIVMDPPYGANVMYAELSDFFYVWLKKTAGHLLPELFTRQLTDKDNEAVANYAKFAGQKGSRQLAARDYQERMQSIFTECHRVLKSSGIMTVMFTHKDTNAWDALATGLIEAGFKITASWPVNTEAEGSLHIKNKSAANSTIFLVCRPRAEKSDDPVYWEDVEPLVAKAVRKKVEEFQAAGIGGVDLYLACFGPALEEFSNHWPLKRGTPRPAPAAAKRKKQADLFAEEFDPFAVKPEDALDAARREVKRWRLEQLTHLKSKAELDPTTSWFVLAWDAFRAPVFPYDEGLRLARAVGVDLDTQIIGRVAEKKASDIVIWDSSKRAAKGALGPVDGSRGMIDALHHAANLGRTRTLDGAKELLEKSQLITDPNFVVALTALLEVLPPSQAFTGIALEGDVAASGSDFEVLEKLRRLVFSAQIREPEQLKLWQDEAAD